MSLFLTEAEQQARSVLVLFSTRIRSTRSSGAFAPSERVRAFSGVCEKNTRSGITLSFSLTA